MDDMICGNRGWNSGMTKEGQQISLVDPGSLLYTEAVRIQYINQLYNCGMTA